MNIRPHRSTVRFACASLAFLTISAVALAADDIARHFGFAALEVLKVDPKAGPLVIADMNGDGLEDIVVIDNFKNRSDVNFQKKGAQDTDDAPAVRGVNEFPEHWRYKRESVTVDRAVEAVVACDWDSDGLMDMIYAGNSPPGVVFVRQTEPGQFKVARKQTIRNLGSNPNALAVANLVGGSAKELVSIVDGKISEIKDKVP